MLHVLQTICVSLLIVAALLVSASGCVRWYESYPEDRDGGARIDSVKPPPPPPGVFNQAHDTCAAAMVIDAATLPKTGLLLTMDHSKAHDDLKHVCSFGQPELVLKLINLTPGAKLTLHCTGGGMVNYAWLDSACPGGSFNCSGGSCSNYSASTTTFTTTRYLLVARSNTSPTVKLTISVGN